MQAGPKQDYTATVVVKGTPQEAFAAITNVRGWWSQEVQGVTDEVGAEFDYHFQDVHRCKVRVTELVPARKVSWLILDNFFNFVGDETEWKGTEVVFEITDTQDGTEIAFTHVGLIPEYECYEVCTNAWAGYIHGSLRDLVNTGLGQPNPKEEGSAPAHQDVATLARAGRSSQN